MAIPPGRCLLAQRIRSGFIVIIKCLICCGGVVGSTGIKDALYPEQKDLCYALEHQSRPTKQRLVELSHSFVPYQAIMLHGCSQHVQEMAASCLLSHRTSGKSVGGGLGFSNNGDS